MNTMIKNRFRAITLTLFTIVSVLFFSCEDVVNVDFQNQTGNYLNIDALINNQSHQQHIRLTQTSGFINASAPTPVLGASVEVRDGNGSIFTFLDGDNNGIYTWSPSVQQPNLGQTPSISYTLKVVSSGTTYTSASTLARVPAFDSMSYEKRLGPLGRDSLSLGIFYAKDLRGQTDFYWVKSFVNGVRTSNVIDQNKLPIDGAYDEGTSDGILFIPPVRYFINSNYKEKEPNFIAGDTLRAELHAIDRATHVFLTKSAELLNNGGQFAVPYYNPGNNITSSASGAKVLGWFNVANVASGEVIAKE